MERKKIKRERKKDKDGKKEKKKEDKEVGIVEYLKYDHYIIILHYHVLMS